MEKENLINSMENEQHMKEQSLISLRLGDGDKTLGIVGWLEMGWVGRAGWAKVKSYQHRSFPSGPPPQY